MTNQNPRTTKPSPTMNQDSIVALVIKAMTDLGVASVPEDELDRTKSFESMGLDSLDILEIEAFVGEQATFAIGSKPLVSVGETPNDFADAILKLETRT